MAVSASPASAPLPPTPLVLLLLALLVTLPPPSSSATATADVAGGSGGSGSGGGHPIVPPLAERAAGLNAGTGPQKEGAGNEGEATDPGIQFFRPGAPSHKIWPFNGRMPCTCQDLGCGCCADMVISSFNFNRTGCMNLTYDPYEFAVVARMFFGESMLFERSFSGKNPPPACVPVPMPYLPSVDFCVQFFDIYTPGRNLHLCMDWLARLQRAPVVVLHFDCMRVGSDGVALLKPEDGDGLPSSQPPSPSPPSPPPDAPPDDIYDEVAPGRNDTLRDTDHLDSDDNGELGQMDDNAMLNESEANKLTVLDLPATQSDQSKHQVESFNINLGSITDVTKGHIDHLKSEINATESGSRQIQIEEIN